MDATALVDAVETDRATELDRLGSQKLLLALTDADLGTGRVLAAAARSERSAHETFAAWADDETDDAARAAFADAADREDAHHERVVAELDAASDATGPDALHAHLRTLDGTAERIGAGLVGRPLVADRTLLQVVNFFVNEADERRADLFRDLREETRAAHDVAAELLDDADDDEVERAREAADEAVLVAYREYAETMDEMGLDVKPLC
jgi:hypothetical protein